MVAGGSDLERQPGHGLAAHLGEVRLRRTGRLGRHCGRLRPRLLAAQHGDELGEGPGGTDPTTLERPCLGLVGHRDDDLGGVHHIDEREGSGDGPEGTVESELPDEPPPRHRLRRKVAGGDQEPHGDGEVEPGPGLGDARGREVHGDPLQRPGETTREQGGADAVARLAARGIGEPDDREAGETGGDVHLDGDRMAPDTEDGCGRDGGQHGHLRATA